MKVSNERNQGLQWYGFYVNEDGYVVSCCNRLTRINLEIYVKRHRHKDFHINFVNKNVYQIPIFIGYHLI